MHIVYMWVHSGQRPSVHPHPGPESLSQLLNLISRIFYSVYDKAAVCGRCREHALCVCTCDLLPWLPEEGWHARRVRQGAASSAYLHTQPDNQRCECGPTITRKTGFYQKSCHFSFCLCIYFRFSETPSSFLCFKANTKMFAEALKLLPGVYYPVLELYCSFKVKLRNNFIKNLKQQILQVSEKQYKLYY